jgi:hypothetical protein
MEEHVRTRNADLKPEEYKARDMSPDATHEPRIPETERPDESPAGMGKGVGLPPGSTGTETGQTPPN